ncbi:MAG: class I SAM-dependent methyltransferase [Nostocales cyanobacterium]|nr:MAG: class I SAM-dependent methyltransferase [Nostocales cyanobacterium]TAF17649.1 MAG: class I SAM-dependent methyltransferase [Nostocales cyanobacterium]
MNHQTQLFEIIANHITSHPQQRITFAEYMDLVLYYPEYGYYSSDAVNIGFQGGDFFTSSSLGDDFGEILAMQFFQMWENLGKPQPFYLVEMGAGKGILASQILNYLKSQHPDFFQLIEYIIVEKSPNLQQEQKQRLAEFSVQWLNWESIKSNSIIGCFFSNELVDAFPVHQFTIEDGTLKEIYVTIQEHKKNDISDYSFTEILGEPSTPKLAEYLKLVNIDISQNTYENGYRSEINLAALDWLSIVADCLQKGYVLTIDYGYPASRYYLPRRSQGTLQCYYQHRHHNNPYINIGKQDITAHVDFTALEIWGEKCGLKTVGWTQQGLFLMALGLGERIAALSHQEQSISQLLKRREALHQLISPEGLGNFGVLVQSKGLTEIQARRSLQGLTIPE